MRVIWQKLIITYTCFKLIHFKYHNLNYVLTRKDYPINYYYIFSKKTIICDILHY